MVGLSGFKRGLRGTGDSACWENVKAICIEPVAVIFPWNNVVSFIHVKKRDKCLTVWPRHPLTMWETQAESLLYLVQSPTSDVIPQSTGIVIRGDGFRDLCLTQNLDLCPL